MDAPRLPTPGDSRAAVAALRAAPARAHPQPQGRETGQQLPPRQVLDGIFYVLLTGCQLEGRAPRVSAPAAPCTTTSRRGSGWGIFRRALGRSRWREEYDELRGIDWELAEHRRGDGHRPLSGGEKRRARTRPTGPSRGPERSILTDGSGVPLGDGRRRRQRTRQVAGGRDPAEASRCWVPEPTEGAPQHFCADKGYDYETSARWGDLGLHGAHQGAGRGGAGEA